MSLWRKRMSIKSKEHMTQNEIIELAIQGHASTRDAIRWAMNQEREACLKIVGDKAWHYYPTPTWATEIAKAIRARGQA
jgi:hypothetical protein